MMADGGRNEKGRGLARPPGRQRPAGHDR